MKDVSATDAARRFSDVLDAVEHRHESFRVVRGGRPIARITPVSHANGAEVLELLSNHGADPAWAEDLDRIRAMLYDEERHWPG